MYNEHIHLY